MKNISDSLLSSLIDLDETQERSKAYNLLLSSIQATNGEVTFPYTDINIYDLFLIDDTSLTREATIIQNLPQTLVDLVKKLSLIVPHNEGNIFI